MVRQQTVRLPERFTRTSYDHDETRRILELFRLCFITAVTLFFVSVLQVLEFYPLWYWYMPHARRTASNSCTLTPEYDIGEANQ